MDNIERQEKIIYQSDEVDFLIPPFLIPSLFLSECGEATFFFSIHPMYIFFQVGSFLLALAAVSDSTARLSFFSVIVCEAPVSFVRDEPHNEPELITFQSNYCPSERYELLYFILGRIFLLEKTH